MIRIISFILPLLVSVSSHSHVHDEFIPLSKVESGITSNGHTYILKAVSAAQSTSEGLNYKDFRLTELEFTLNGNNFPIPIERLNIPYPRLDFPLLIYGNGYCVTEGPEVNGLRELTFGGCEHTVYIRIVSGIYKECEGENEDEHPNFDEYILTYNLEGELLSLEENEACGYTKTPNK